MTANSTQKRARQWTNALADWILISGSFSVTNSVFNSAQSGPWFTPLVSATVTVCYNTITRSSTPTRQGASMMQTTAR
jgi:hypothetical protein